MKTMWWIKGFIFSNNPVIGHERGNIFRLLQPLKMFEDTSRVRDCQRSDRPRTSRRSQAIKAVKPRIDRNPLRKQWILSREMNISKQSISRILKHDLRFSAFKWHTGQWTSTHESIEKCARTKIERAAPPARGQRPPTNSVFTAEESFNKQNDLIARDMRHLKRFLDTVAVNRDTNLMMSKVLSNVLLLSMTRNYAGDKIQEHLRDIKKRADNPSKSSYYAWNISLQRRHGHRIRKMNDNEVDDDDDALDIITGRVISELAKEGFIAPGMYDLHTTSRCIWQSF